MKLLNFLTLPTLITSSVMMAETEKPNVVIFVVDDMGVMDTSLPFLTDHKGKCLEQPLNKWYKTPNMERMAKKGIRFSTFYAQSVSSPTRCTLLTGQNSTRHRTTNWIAPESNNRGKYGPKDWNWGGIHKKDITLPKLMQEAGYRTIHVGKAHFSPKKGETANPIHAGFDINIAGGPIGHPGSYLGEEGYGNLNHAYNPVQGLEKYHGTSTFLTEALTLEAKEQLKKSVEINKPFFLYLAHYAVHAPFYTDKRFIKHYEGKSKAARAFATLIEGMDKSLGDIMDQLEELGVAENTIILFMGDNGSDAPLGKKEGYSSSAPLRGKKGTMYEGGVRVPFIAAWAKSNAKNKWQKKFPIKQNSIQLQWGSVMDIFPTVLEVAGIKNPSNHVVDGYSLFKQLKGKKSTQRKNHLVMHFPHPHNSSYFTTLHEKNWKLIYQYHPATPKEPTYLLFDLTNDPAEKINLSNRYPKRVKKMVKNLIKQMEKEKAVYPIDSKGNELHPIIPE